MFDSFNDKPDTAPYVFKPAQIELNAINSAVAYGAERSLKMDFDEYDRIDDFELNEILWRAIKGKEAPIPPAVRRAIAYGGIERSNTAEGSLARDWLVVRSAGGAGAVLQPVTEPYDFPQKYVLSPSVEVTK